MLKETKSKRLHSICKDYIQKVAESGSTLNSGQFQSRFSKPLIWAGSAVLLSLRPLQLNKVGASHDNIEVLGDILHPWHPKAVPGVWYGDSDISSPCQFTC